MTQTNSTHTEAGIQGQRINPAVRAAIEKLSEGGIEERGAIFTRPEVVEFILDLVGYTADKPLHSMRLLEPSFGNGDFLLTAVSRLLYAYRRHGGDLKNAVTELRSSIKAVELHRGTFQATREKLASILRVNDVPQEEVEALLDAWLVSGDFLLEPLGRGFTHILGNPPYVRQELIPDVLVGEYRSRFRTVYDRADLYIPFIEKSLTLLGKGGTLGFICSDRWMKNRYGGPLRCFVAGNFHLKFYVDMVDTPAFHSDVIAYPAIVIIQNEKQGPTRIAHRPDVDRGTLKSLAADLAGGNPGQAGRVKELHGVTSGAEPWILESPDQLAVVRRLEAEFPSIEEAGCKVRIGVATGADKVFIGRYDELYVEPDRKIPLVMTRDIITGEVKWRGMGVINPFRDDGGLVNLSDYPMLAAYLNKHGDEIRKRHVSQKNPKGWYRTIDRIFPRLAQLPKLLIPDIKGEASVVYEAGQFYPHHNLYYITSDEWDLKALQAVLRSGIAKLFVSIYSTKMHGGYLRYQAQYLRRIRLPRWTDVKRETQEALIRSAEQEDAAGRTAAVCEMYGLNRIECASIGGSGE